MPISISGDGLISGSNVTFASAVTGNSSITGTPLAMAGENISPFHGMRNRVINGGMDVWQRGTSFTGITTSTYTADVMQCNLGTPGTGVFSVVRSTDVPAGQGLSYSWRLTPTTAMSSVGAATFLSMAHNIESNLLSDLSYGTSSAQNLVLSFWVKSNITGIVPGNIAQAQAGSRVYPFIYNINAADTWQKITVVIPGDTSGSASMPATNVQGVHMNLGYMAIGSQYQNGTANIWNTNASLNQWIVSGQTYINRASSTSNYLAFTGVQLERGTVATPFECRHYGQELALCQRYYLISRGYTGLQTGEISGTIYFPVQMRAAPTITQTYLAGLAGALSGTDVSQNECQWWKSNSTSNFYRWQMAASAEF
jgi:hypothetical protein